MNGPEHYAAAEKLAGEANGADVEFARYLLAKAQVHATLAAAAAQIELALSMQAGNGVSVEWLEAVR